MTHPAPRLLLLLAAVMPLLAGCFGAVAVGAGAGALLLADRRPTETYLMDEGIEVRAANRINEKFGDRVHVNATSYNRMLLLTGEAYDAAARNEAEKLAATVPNVKSIANEIIVAPTSGFSARSNDSYITSKVKARFVDASKFSPNHVKVVTEGGTVYLLGLVTKAEGEAAVEIARTTSGVQKVVRVFETISEAEAKALELKAGQPAEQKPAAAAPAKK